MLACRNSTPYELIVTQYDNYPLIKGPVFGFSRPGLLSFQSFSEVSPTAKAQSWAKPGTWELASQVALNQKRSNDLGKACLNKVRVHAMVPQGLEGALEKMGVASGVGGFHEPTSFQSKNEDLGEEEWGIQS